MKFTKSLKFKLTIWYSLILSMFCIAFVLVINLWITQYMNTWAPESGVPRFIIDRVERPRLRALSEEQMQLIMDARLSDLENIRELSVYAVIPLVLFSFGAGYILAIIMLKPLEKLNSEIKRKEADNLNEEIIFRDNGDEISELIKSFNRMSRRLNYSFESQKQFVENASHELKTPLAVIQANLETVLEDSTVTKEELYELLDSSKRQIVFMNELTEDLLLMTLKDDVEMEELDISKTMKRVVKNLENEAKKKKIKLLLDGFKKTIFIKGNDVLLERAFSNIVENSIKYSEGTIIHISEKKVGENVRITFADDGKGIPKEKIKVVFERFFRLDKGRSRKIGGKGLGLAITKEIVEKHGGEVYVNEKYTNGAEFVVVLKYR